jgi:hypothetical protein
MFYTNIRSLSNLGGAMLGTGMSVGSTELDNERRQRLCRRRERD